MRSSVCCEFALQQAAVLNCTWACWWFEKRPRFQPVCLRLQIDAERSPDQVFAQICRSMESGFWYLHLHTPNSAVEEGPSKKTFSLSLCRHPKETHSHNLTPAPDSLNSSGMHVLPAISETSLSAFWHWQSAWLSHSASQKCIPPTPSPLLSLSVKSTSIYAANCHTKADNCTEKNSSPCCDWEHAGSEISPPSHQRSWARFPLPYYKVEMSVCTHALTHSTLLLIVTSMQELKVKLNCLLCIKFKKEKKNRSK